ncbi:MAG: hypothetical protein HY927_09805 [Elusimicrobia bacterium]|nr:hypothetical protein [Elusimicrobiota bacterium]
MSRPSPPCRGLPARNAALWLCPVLGLMFWAADSRAQERELDLTLSLGALVPVGESAPTMKNSNAISLAADWWIVDYFSIGMEFCQAMGHKVTASRQALLRPDAAFDWDRLQNDLRIYLGKSGLAYEINDGISGSLKRTGFFFAPDLKFGKYIEGFGTLFHAYFSMGAGLYHSVLAGSITFGGIYADGTRFSKAFPIERKINDDIGIALGAGFMMRGMNSRMVYGFEMRYLRIMKDSGGYAPDVFLSPMLKVGYSY